MNNSVYGNGSSIHRAQTLRSRLPLRRVGAMGNRIAYTVTRGIRKPIHAVHKWWIKRNALPPTKNGRVIPIELGGKPRVDERTNKGYCSNVISSANYSVYDFLPRQLIYQFSKLANIYFLFVSILQMVPSWSTTGNYTTIVPLMIFVTISISREGYDDWKRHKVDKTENLRETLVAKPAAANPYELDYVSTRWKDIKVGDIVRVQQNEWVPADLILLHSSGLKGQTFAETMALDGETNLKIKEVAPELQDLFRADNIPHIKDVTCVTEDPNLDLYNFEGNIILPSKQFPLGNQNVLYRGCVLRNTASCFGLVIFTGKETKIQQNALKSSRAKSPKLQTKVNWIVVLMALFVILLSLIGAVASNAMQRNRDGFWYLEDLDVGFVPNFMGFIIMFNTLIPLSLYVSLEICKIFQKLLMEADINMYDASTDTPFKCQTTSLNEELGQVSYIFSDKTGTLTENIMLFRKLTVAGYAWLHDLDLFVDEDPDSTHIGDTSDNSSDTGVLGATADKEKRDYLYQRARHGRAPSLELFQQIKSLPRKSLNAARMSSSSAARKSTNLPKQSQGRLSTTSVKKNWTATAVPGKPQTTPSTLSLLEYIMAHPNSLFAQKTKFFLLSLALCHSASPVVDLAEVANGRVEIEYLDYQAASPDELALVSAARDLGYLVIDRQYDDITLRTYPNGFKNDPVDEHYKVLDTIDFTSSRKRMSTVVRLPDGRVCLFTKGADNVMIEKLSSKILEAARQKRVNLESQGELRRSIEAEVVKQRKSSIDYPGSPLGLGRPSIGMDHTAAFMALDQHLHQKQHEEQDIQESSRRSVQLHHARSIEQVKSATEKSNSFPVDNKQKREGGTSVPPSPLKVDTSGQINETTPVEIDNRQVVDERFVIEQTLAHVDEFSTEGLRTLMYGHRFLSEAEYQEWKTEYDGARASLVDRASRIEEVGEKLERDYELTGATAIEDKLQHGVPETIEKLRRANIKLWMLTGDKRETAINIGYSCRLIKDYSTLIILKSDQDLESTILAALEEISRESVAHCVVVIDGQTLSHVEQDPALMSLFIDLSLRADSVICCRASPAQKATMVKRVHERQPQKVTLAIGDGANDIAMIKAADLGIGITGREGLQAARSSDYAMGQFRFLLNLLLVHGRWNYVRTCKYILATFYKEFLFYMAQFVFQRWTLFTGTSLYESWSISMFNTLFTSLPVIALGVLDQDLDASTLIAVPELYRIGQKCQCFNVTIFIGWLCLAMIQCVGVMFLSVEGWGKTPALIENDLFPLGVIVFDCVVIIINIKLLCLEMRLLNIITALCGIISVLGYQMWNFLIGALNSNRKTYRVTNAFRDEFGRNPAWWACMIGITAICLFFDVVVNRIRKAAKPTETDVYVVLERDPHIQKRLEQESTMELGPIWKMQAEMDTHWSAIFRGHWPAQSLSKDPAVISSRPRRRDMWLEKLRKGRTPSNYDFEIDDILERRERELNMSAPSYT